MNVLQGRLYSIRNLLEYRLNIMLVVARNTTLLKIQSKFDR